MLEVTIVLVLIALNGLFALSELAVVNARRSRLRAMAEGGVRGATAALALSEDPGRFLPTVQSGITLVSILTGTFSGAALGSSVAVRLFRVRCEPETAVTDDEIHAVVADAKGAGVIDPEERHMISGVMRLGDRPVRGVMTPRTDIDWIDLNGSDDEIRVTLAATQHSRLPVGEGTPDGMLGVVQTRELPSRVLSGGPLDVRTSVRSAPAIPDTEALDALAVLRSAEVPMALVHDEYGHFEGVVIPADLLEAIAGVFRADTDSAEPAALRREDGSWLLAGWLPADEMAAHLHIRLPSDRDYHTAAGYVLAEFRRIPEAGEQIGVGDWRFEVVDLQGHRINKLIAVSVSHFTDGRGPAERLES